LLQQAALIARPTSENDPRSFWLGCIGIREDGVAVSSKNGAVEFQTTIENYQLVPSSHAEGRVLRKLGKGGIMFVARVSRKDGSLAMARPCGMCQVRLRSFKVKKVFYTINDTQYGVWYPDSDTDKIFKV
jgi:tRNA(Arg) A34 adenosine deaminase TadA